MMHSIHSARDVWKRGGKRMLLQAAVFSKTMRIFTSQVRNISALLRSWSLFLLGCQLITSPGQDGPKLVNICCQFSVADLSVVPSGQT